jgi:ABC-type dipeptide/oligopeptide/nickel transport system permease component
MNGAAYVIHRTIYAVLTIIAALTLNFFLFRVLPGSAVTNLSRVPGASLQLRHELTAQFGLNKPKWEQFLIYLRELAHGNLGVSYEYELSVRSLIWTAVKNTIPMVGLGTLIAIVAGVLSGLVGAWRRNRLTDHLTSSTAIAFWAMPVQWLALLLLVEFSSYLPTNGMMNPYLLDPTWFEHLKDVLRHMILPSAAVALTLYGQFALITRSSVLETLGQDYILTARAKGLTNRRIIVRHALRNALLPIVTLAALAIGQIVGGVVLIESVFSWPGIGLVTYHAVLARDYPMLQGAFLTLALSVVLCNYVADLLYFKLDPRIAQ